MVLSESKDNTEHEPGADMDAQPNAPVTYTFDGRAFIVQPVFKGEATHTFSDALLRLMRADIEQS